MEMKFPDAVEENRKKVNARLLQVKSNRNLTANIGILTLVLISAAVRFLVHTDEVPHLKDIVFDTVLLYIISSLTYSIRYQVGIDRGKRDEEYAKAIAAFEQIRETVQENSNMDELQEFCIRLQRESIDTCRKEMLLPSNIPAGVHGEIPEHEGAGYHEAENIPADADHADPVLSRKGGTGQRNRSAVKPRGHAVLAYASAGNERGKASETGHDASLRKSTAPDAVYRIFRIPAGGGLHRPAPA